MFLLDELGFWEAAHTIKPVPSVLWALLDDGPELGKGMLGLFYSWPHPYRPLETQVVFQKCCEM